ncbi:hypothetical protein [Longivirga aurantiaca]|uniref:Ribbon-helix-helix protein CopG domain-containing protein n=1 Tax=Longivirga aurantiaca TaxID=1837743 RepID=A0ABW1SWH8_9ACTN
MTNPTPRPALRKAEDADVHPAAPQPVRRPRTPRTAEPATAETPAPAKRAPAKAAGAGAAPASAAARSAKATKPTPVPAEPDPSAAAAEIAAEPAVPATPKKSKRYQTPPAVPVKNKRKRTGFSGTTSDHLRRTDAPAAAAAENADKAAKKRAKADAALLTGSLATVKVKLPKKLAKAAEKEAARRGLDLDAVTAELLHTWLTHRP